MLRPQDLNDISTDCPQIGTCYDTRVESMPVNFQDERTQNEARGNGNYRYYVVIVRP